VVGSGDLFQIDSSGNAKAPTLALGTATIAPTERTLSITDSTVLTNSNQYNSVFNQTYTGTLTGNVYDYGIYNSLTVNATDDQYFHFSTGLYSLTALSSGNTTDYMYGGQFDATNNSSALDPITSRTATASAGVRGNATNASSGVVWSQSGGSFTSNNQSTGTVNFAYGSTGTVSNTGAGTIDYGWGSAGAAYANSGTITEAEGTRGHVYTNADTASIVTAYGTYGRAYENVTHTSGGITNAYGGFFRGEDATTSYGLYALGVQDSSSTETFTNLYGAFAACQSNSSTVTVSNCYALRGQITESLGTITTGYAGYLESAAAMSTGYGLYSTLTGASTTSYGVYSTVSSAATQYGLYSLTSSAAAGTAYGLYVDAGTGAGTEYAGIFLNGNVGIGTTTPASKLTVNAAEFSNAVSLINTVGGAGDYSPNLAFTTFDGTSRYIRNTNNYLTLLDSGGLEEFQLHDTQLLYTGGNVGIADTSPDAKIEVLSTSEQLRLTNVDDTNDCRFTVSATGDMVVDCLGSGTTEQLVLGDGDTLNIGSGTASDVAYNLIANSGETPEEAGIASDNDLYIGGSLEVDGTIYGTVSGTINPGFTTGSVIFQGASGLAEDNPNFFWDDTNNRLGILDNTPAYAFVVGSGDLFQIDSSGNAKAPTLALGTATVAPTDRTLYVLDSTALSNSSQYGSTFSQTYTGTLTGNVADYGIYNQLIINATDATFSHTSTGIRNDVRLSNGNTTDYLYGFYSDVYNDSTTLSPDTLKTATTSGAIRGNAYNTSSGIVYGQYGGILNSYNQSTGTVDASYGVSGGTSNQGTGTITTGYGVSGSTQTINAAGTIASAYGTAGQALTNFDGSSITVAYGAYGRAYENVAHTSGGVSTGYGGYFISEDATTAYGLFAQGIQNTSATETFTNLYGARVDCSVNSSTATVTNC
jgi:hypothetical protein